MHQTLRDVVDVFSEKIENLCNEMKQMYDLNEFQHIRISSHVSHFYCYIGSFHFIRQQMIYF